MLRHLAAAALAAISFTASAADASVVVTSGTRGATIGTSGPIGQTFVADGVALSSFGFQFATGNTAAENTPVTFQLLLGAGLTGAEVVSRTATLSIPTGRTPTWYDFDLTGTTLVLGQSYTALVSTGSTRLSLIFGPNLSTSGVPASGDAYLPGSLIATRSFETTTPYCATNNTCDANFRFTSLAAAAVPEPATWAMMMVGLFAVGASMRARRSGGATLRAA